MQVYAQYNYKILNIDKSIERRMLEGNSHRAECPVKLDDLRYLSLEYLGFNEKPKIGELIVHKDVAKDIVNIFEELFKVKYPIEKMKLVSDYNSKDFDSIEDNNTSAYNCRVIAGTNKLSNHAFGKAIDINPLQNPYISKKGKIAHQVSLVYKDRIRTNPFDIKQRAMILKNDLVVKLFKKYGWRWGGDWVFIKDYQHFDKKD